MDATKSVENYVRAYFVKKENRQTVKSKLPGGVMEK